MKLLDFNPPLLNTPCPWCSTLDQLRALYASPHLGAVTTRTSMLEGFSDDPNIHQFVFFEPITQKAGTPNFSDANSQQNASLNTIGFSPYTLDQYLSFIQTISDEQTQNAPLKPFIVSVTGTPQDMQEAYVKILNGQDKVKMELVMEINLSCPNIPGKISPAYSREELLLYLRALQEQIARQQDKNVAIGIKTPPFTYEEQYGQVIGALLDCVKKSPLPISYIASTNTLGSSLLMQNNALPQSVLNSMASTGIGGMAGAPLHALSLGNVFTFRQLLNKHKELKSIQLIGIGGVADIAGYRRMKSAGAYAVGIATALGIKGITLFEEIHQQM